MTRKHRIRKRRMGTTLIETLVLGALTSLALTSLSMLTHSLLTSSRRITDTAQVRQVAARLQSRLWNDSASALFSDQTFDNGVTVWRIALAENRNLDYRVNGRTVDRTITGSDGKIEHRDQFRLPPTYRFAANGDNGRMELRIEQEVATALGQDQNHHPTGLRVFALFLNLKAEAAP